MSQKSHWSGVGKTATLKAVVLPVSAILTLFTMREIIGVWGVDAYASYGLLITLVALLPFADLGMAAVVINAVTDLSEKNFDKLGSVLLAVLRVLLISAAILIGLGLSITLLGLWSKLLGGGLLPGVASEWAVFWCITLFSLNLPISIGTRALVGLGRNGTLILVQAAQYPFILAGILMASQIENFPPAYLPLFAYVASILVSLACIFISARKIGPSLGWSVRRIFSPSIRSEPIGHTAWPMLAQSVAIPVATQSDRIIISQISGAAPLAQYNLASQVFMTVWQITSSAGVTLWPAFRKMRAEKSHVPVVSTALLFCLFSLICGLALYLVIPFAESFIGHNEITIPAILSISFVAYVALNGLLYPFGMFLTDPAGLRYQAFWVLIALPANLVLSICFTTILGAAGPVAGSAISMLLFQIVPYHFHYKKYQKKA